MRPQQTVCEAFRTKQPNTPTLHIGDFGVQPPNDCTYRLQRGCGEATVAERILVNIQDIGETVMDTLIDTFSLRVEEMLLSATQVCEVVSRATAVGFIQILYATFILRTPAARSMSYLE